MTPHIVLLSPPIDAMRTDAPILIRVPALESANRTSVHSQFRSRATIAPRRGRRLRREVRVAASALIFALPMSWALMAFARIGPDSSSSSSSASISPPAALVAGLPKTPEPSDDGPGVTITLDPSAVASPYAPASDAPTVMPAGYLVPDDDGSEDTAHAGN